MAFNALYNAVRDERDSEVTAVTKVIGLFIDYPAQVRPVISADITKGLAVHTRRTPPAVLLALALGISVFVSRTAIADGVSIGANVVTGTQCSKGSGFAIMFPNNLLPKSFYAEGTGTGCSASTGKVCLAVAIYRSGRLVSTTGAQCKQTTGKVNLSARTNVVQFVAPASAYRISVTAYAPNVQ